MNLLFMHQAQAIYAPLRSSYLMEPGKVPPEVLESIVYANLGIKDSDVLLGPGLGEDAALIKIGDKVIVAATDPITGSIEDIGWLAVHVNANDIATFGVAPRWFLASVMLPYGFTSDALETIMQQIDDAAKNLGIAVVGGHSEITERINQPIVTGFMIGLTNNNEYVTSHGAQPGDSLILTKCVGLEGTSILASEGYSYLIQYLDDSILQEAMNLRHQISVVSEGVNAFQTGFVTAMHDPTEGGVSGGIHELCDASNVGFEIEYERIPIAKSTKRICEVLNINPLELISSGCMLISCIPDHSQDIIETLDSVGVESKVIGSLTNDKKHHKLSIEGSLVDLSRPKTDALWGALKKINPS
ncbi:hydrogenase [Candidatus Thorarchaeota archaeon]|nr:MAG: hydrogenase [Candidatus Thorarchaeota archaeon]